MSAADLLTAALLRVPGVTRCYVRKDGFQNQLNAVIAVTDIERDIDEHVRAAIAEVVGETGEDIHVHLDVLAAKDLIHVAEAMRRS
jgi:hypothetical protein